MTTFDEHAQAAAQALGHERVWAIEHINAMSGMYNAVLEQRDEFDHRDDGLRDRARAAVKAANKAKLLNRQRAAELHALEEQLAKATSRYDMAEDRHAEAIRANRRVTTNLNMALTAQAEQRDRITALSQTLTETEEALSDATAQLAELEKGIRVIPRRYGHRGDICDCAACTYVREVLA